MPLTFVLLQVANAAFAAATLWIHFRNPFLWDDQAIVLSTCAGTFVASLTAVILGLSLLFGSGARFLSAAINLFLTLAFAGLQGYFLWLTARDLGVVQALKARLGF